MKVLNAMAAMKKSPLVPEVLDLWWACMADWDIEDFKAAAIQILKTAQFMPTPKDFEDLRKAGQDTGGEAFANLRQWLIYSPAGYTLKAETPHRIAAAIRAIGGPTMYALCDVEKLPFLERRFCDHYEQIGDADGTRRALPAIARKLLQ